jgi:cysteine desulfurase/selenocysteine lyase
LAQENNLVIRELPLSTDFTIDVDKLSNEITAKAKVFAFASITNTIGAINDLAKISQAIRAKNPEAIIVVDATQSVAHEPIDVQKVDVDFLAFSAHKMYGPFGVGVLYGKSQWLAQIPPLTYGGGNNTVIDLKTLSYELTPVPSRFEAGSPNIAGIAAFGATLDFLNQIGFSTIEAHEKELKNYLVEQFESKHLAQQVEAYNLEIPGPTFIFNVKGLNPQDVAAFLAEDYLIATRSGAHCARTIHDRHFKHSVRVTFGLYNTREDIDRLIEALSHLENVFDHLTR